jgi:hypothetical protein
MITSAQYTVLEAVVIDNVRACFTCLRTGDCPQGRLRTSAAVFGKHARQMLKDAVSLADVDAFVERCSGYATTFNEEHKGT